MARITPSNSLKQFLEISPFKCLRGYEQNASAQINEVQQSKEDGTSADSLVVVC